MFFFFKQKAAYEIVSRDWSSDVCSSDLTEINHRCKRKRLVIAQPLRDGDQLVTVDGHSDFTDRKSVV